MVQSQKKELNQFPMGRKKYQGTDLLNRMLLLHLQCINLQRMNTGWLNVRITDSYIRETSLD